MFGYLCEIAAVSTIMGYVSADAQSTSYVSLTNSRIAGLNTHTYIQTPVTNEILKGLYICADVRIPSFGQTYVLWVPVIVYDTILCLLVVWPCVRTWISAYRRAGARWTDSVRTITITDELVAGNAGNFFGYVGRL